MPVGKSSLGRVAAASTLDAPEKEVAATVAKAAPQKAEKKAPKPEKPVARKIGVTFAVGDELPEYLL